MEEEEAGLDPYSPRTEIQPMPDDPGEAIAEATVQAPEPVGVVNASTTASLPVDPTVGDFKKDDWTLQENNDVTYRMYSKKGDQAISEQQKLFSQLMEDEQEAPIEVETWEVIKRGATDGTLVTAISNLADDVTKRFTDPEYWQEDPNFKVTDDMLEGYLPHQQAAILEAKNERQAREAQARAIRFNETQEMVSKAGWGAWLGNMGVTFLVEGGLAMGGGIASGGLNIGSKIGAKLFSGAIKNSRVLGMTQAGTAGAIGAGAQGAFELNQNVISAQEAAIYPVMGLMFGGALGGVFPHAVGGVAKAMGDTTPGVRLNDAEMIDPMMAKLEEAEIAVARVQALQQAQGVQLVPGQAKHVDFNQDTNVLAANAKARKERPDLDPSEWVHGEDTDMQKALADMTDDMDVDIAPQSRRILWEEDLVQRIRDPEVAEEATKMFDKDLDSMDSAFALSKPPKPGKIQVGEGAFDAGWNPNVAKVAKAAGEAMRRQGYRFEPTGGGKSQKLYMVDHPHNHKVAAESGQGIRHAYEDPTHAAKYADQGAKIVEIEVPAGAKVIEGQGLSPAVGTHGEFMIGDGKPLRRADGTWEWKPNKEVTGNKQIISGKGHDGVALSPAEILHHNRIQGTRARNGYSDDVANKPGAGVGANIIARREYNMDQSANAQDFLANPHAGFEKQGWGPRVTRAGLAGGTDNPMGRVHSPDFFGGVKDLSRKNLDLDVYGSSIGDKVGRMNGNDNSAINVAEQQAYVKWIKWNNDNGVKMSKDPLRKEMEFRQAVADYRNAVHDAHHFAQNRAGQDAQAYINSVQNSGVHELHNFFEKFYSDKMNWMKDPGAAFGEPGKYESVGGAADMGVRAGYTPFFPDLSQLKAWEAKGFHGGIYQVYKGLLTKKFVGEGMQQAEAEQLAETVGRIYSNSMMERGGNTAFDSGHLRMATSSENMVVIMKQMGVSDHLAQQLKTQVDKMMDNSDASFGNVMERLQVPLTEKVKVKHYQNPSLTQDMSLSDFMLKNPNTSAKIYGRKSNGWVALATTARRNSKGQKLTHDIPVIDPKTKKPQLDANGQPVMKTVPWTLRDQGEVDKFLRDLRSVGEELNVDANTRMERRKVANVYEEAIDSYLNRSKENPHELMQAAMNMNLARTMGNSGWSSVQELGMLTRMGIHGWQELLSYRNLMRDFKQAGLHIASGGKFREPEDAHSALGFVTGHNMGTAERSNLGNQNTQFDNSQLALVGSSTAGKLNKAAVAHRAQQKLTEAVLKYSGLLPLQDALQYRAGLAYLNKIGKMASKYKSSANLPRSQLTRLKRMGMTSRDIDQVFNYLNSGAVTRKKGDFGVTVIDRLDPGAPGFDAAAHDKLGDAIYRTVTKNVIMEQKMGAKFPGMDTTVMSMFTQLQSFQMASMSQMMNNYAREFGESLYDIGKGMKDGNWGAKDGVLDGLRSFAGLGGTLAFAMGGAIGVEILKQEFNNRNQPEEYKKKMRENYDDTNWLVHTGIDKSGIFSFIPWVHDSFVSPVMMANGWSGYKDYDLKHGGIKGIAEHFALNNLTGNIPDDFNKAGAGIMDIASGNATSKSYTDAMGAFTNLWIAKEALNEVLKASGVKMHEKKEPPKPNVVKNLQEGAKKTYKKEIKRTNNVYNYWFGDK